ncbi:MAG: hypothetical protein FJX76_20135 [Armatimonadetes bacterium]|nr:hypothetical protein [Armatimonadota bacterium]
MIAALIVVCWLLVCGSAWAAAPPPIEVYYHAEFFSEPWRHAKGASDLFARTAWVLGADLLLLGLAVRRSRRR